MKLLNFKGRNLKIVEKFKFFAPIALCVIIAGAIVMGVLGLNVGLDFGGGVKMEANMGTYLNYHDGAKHQVEKVIKDTVEANGFDWSYTRWSSDGDDVVAEIGLNYKYNGKKIDSKDATAQSEFTKKVQGNEVDTSTALNTKIMEALNKYSEANFNGEMEVEEAPRVRIVNASTFTKLLKNSIWATLAAVAVILIYICIRFTFSSGLAAIIALCHDVLVMIALTAMFRIEVNVTFIAAIITIVGYSINATIVIFDRIRELKKADSLKDASDAEIANRAIADTLGRSILTTLTTLVVIVALAIVCSIMGVTSMNEFALPIIFGLVAGAYSSVLLSAPMWVILRKIGGKIKNGGKSKKQKA